MFKSFVVTILAMSIGGVLYGQDFKTDGFRYTGGCELSMMAEGALLKNTRVYQCVSVTSHIDVYRAIVVDFNERITDLDAYYDGVIEGYQSKGVTSEILFKNRRAVQLVENLIIEGHFVKQISVSILHRNKSLTFVYLTNNKDYEGGLEAYKANVSLY